MPQIKNRYCITTSSVCPDNALAKAFTSITFWAANASHGLISLSNLVSFSKSIAVWRREQDVETTILSAKKSYWIRL